MRVGMVLAMVLLAVACSSSAEPDAKAAADRFVTEHPTLGPVDHVEVWGDEAMARTGDTRMYLHRFDDGWRVTGAGCRGEPGECEVGGR